MSGLTLLNGKNPLTEEMKKKLEKMEVEELKEVVKNKTHISRYREYASFLLKKSKRTKKTNIEIWK